MSGAKPLDRTYVRIFAAMFAPFLGLLSGCSRPGKVERAITARIRQCPDVRACRISLKDVTNFDWDTMYAFEYGATEQERKRVLGVKDEGFVEFESQLVFVKGSRIVFQESEPTDVERPLKEEIVFGDLPEKADGFKSYGRDSAFSVAEYRNDRGEPYWVLKQIP